MTTATEKLTAAAALKSYVAPGAPIVSATVEDLLEDLIDDKDYDRGVIVQLSQKGVFGTLAAKLLLHGVGNENNILEMRHVINHFGKRLTTLRTRSPGIEPYTGSPVQNTAIDRMMALGSTPQNFVGQGAASNVVINDVGSDLPRELIATPIAVIGFGAAGIMAASSLRTLGFTNIKVFEKQQTLGIWAKPTVHEGSRNNPREILFNKGTRLLAAPGNGLEVKTFLERLTQNQVTKTDVERIEPGDLDHAVVTKEGISNFPIVINAIGLGDPVPVSDTARMTGPSGRVVAMRWQNPKLRFDEVHGKRFLLIGLGNSTAEMIRQLHRFEDEGVDVDYRILTHYPRDAIFNPMDSVPADGRNYRVFRDMSLPVLTSFQGDLPEARSDYFRALYAGRIVSDIKHWNIKDDRLGAFKSQKAKDSAELEIDFQQLCLLTGYRHSPRTFEAMGCVYDKDRHCTHYDYDGELTKNVGAIGGQRMHRGYFGFGAVLNAPHDKNSVVIPGMVFRLPDLLFGVVMRAAEYQRRIRTT